MESEKREKSKLGLADMEQVARRLETVCASLRAGLGCDNSGWEGLQQAGAHQLRESEEPESTQRLARELAETIKQADSDQSLAFAFMLRQFEIAMTLLASTSSEIGALKQRVDRLERNLAGELQSDDVPDRLFAPNERI